MRTVIVTLLLIFVSLLNGAAEDSSQWSLPENAIARIGRGQVIDMAYSPDGKLLAVGTSIGTWLYDAHTKTELALFTAHAGKVTSVAFSPDGMTLATVDYHHTIYLWDTSTKEHKATLTGSTGYVAYSPDGKMLGSGGSSGQITLWDTNTLQQKAIIKTDSYNPIAFSPDGGTIASADPFGKIRLWDINTGQNKYTLTGHRNKITSLSFSPDGETLASGSWDKTIRLWNPKTGKQKTTLIGHSVPIYSVMFSPDGETLASSDGDKTIRLWNPKTGEQKTTLTGHKSGIETLVFSPDGVTLASGSYDGTIRFWDIRAGKHKTTIRHTQYGRRINLSPDGKTLAISGYGEIQLWDVDTHKLKTVITRDTEPMYYFFFSQDGTTLIGEGVKEPMVWDTKTGKRLEMTSVFANEIFSNTSPDKRTFSADGTTLAAGKRDGMIELWDMQSRKRKVTLAKSTNDVSAIAISDDGAILATASHQTIDLWDTGTGEHKATFPKKNITPTVLVFSRDGTMLAGGDRSGAVHFWNVKKGTYIPTFGHQRTRGLNGISSLAFSTDESTLASGSMDYTVRLWDTATGHHLETFGEHPREINASSGGITWLAFSPTDATLFSRSEDGTIHYWDATPVVDTDATVLITPSPIQSPAIGEQLTLDIEITNGKQVTGYDVTVEYDETALRYLSSKNGGYFLGDASFEAKTSKIIKVEDFHNVTYQPHLKLVSKMSDGFGNGDGTLASVTFEVIQAKASTINLPTIRLEKSDGSLARPIVGYGTVLDPLHAQNIPVDYTEFALPDGAIARLGKGIVNDIKLSPDDKLLAVAGSAGIWLYDAKTGNELALLTGHTKPVSVIAFSPRGDLLASGSYDGKLRLWNPYTRQLIRTLNTQGRIAAISFSPDGKTIANGIGDDIQLWDTHTGQHKHNISRGESSIFYLAFSPDGHTLASASISDNIQLWDPHTGKQKLTFDKKKHGYKTSIKFSPGGPRIAFSPDGKTLASTAVDNMRGTSKRIKLWNTQTGELLTVLEEDTQRLTEPVSAVQFSPDGQTLIGGSRDGTLHKWNLKTGECIQPFGRAVYGKLFLLPFLPDSTTLARILRDNTIQLFNIETGEIVFTLTGHRDAVSSIALSSDGKTLASANNYKIIQLWDMQTRRTKATIHDDNRFSLVALSPDSAILASPFREEIRFWDTTTQQHIATLTGHKNKVGSIVFSPNGQTIVSCESNMIELWDVHTAKHKTSLQGHTSHINSLSFSPDGKMLASASGNRYGINGDNKVRIWDTSTGKQLAEFKNLMSENQEHPHPITSVAFSPDGKTVVSTDKSANIQLWDVHTKKHKATINVIPHKSSPYAYKVDAVTFSPDGRTLVVGLRERISSRDGDYDKIPIIIWDLERGVPQRILAGHTEEITSLAYSADGTTLVSGSKDGTVVLWEMRPSPIPRLNITPFSVESPPTGKQLTFNINTTDAENITGYEFTLQYDAKALQYIPNTEDSPKIKNLTTTPPIVAENSITFSGNVTQDSSIDDGTIATVTFEVLQPTDVTLTLTDAHLTHKDDEDSRPIAGHAWVVEPPRMPEDVNRDWQLDAADLKFVSSRLGQTGKGNTADINGDGIVDLADLVLVANALNAIATE